MNTYTAAELRDLKLANIGDDVHISQKVSFYNPAKISLGSHVRIDDFCVLSAGQGGIEIGNYVHIAVFCSLIGAGRIQLGDFSNLSSRVSIYSSNDDYSGEHMTNPMVPSRFTGVQQADVSIGKHVIIGSGSVVLPGTNLREGVAVGALSLVRADCEEFGVYAGIPAEKVGVRKRRVLELERQLRLERRNSGL